MRGPRCGSVLSCCVCKLPPDHEGRHFCANCCDEWGDDMIRVPGILGPTNG
jgi:hypothetical protein